MLAKLIEKVKTYALINHKCSNTVNRQPCVDQAT